MKDPRSPKTVKSDSLLLLTALIWGFAFVAQRVGMDYVGPFTFNGLRFALGSLVLLPFVLRNGIRTPDHKRRHRPLSLKIRIGGPLAAGIVLFAGASLQQAGLVYTTAGNAGFITGLYVVIVPILGIFVRQNTNTGTWIGAIMAAVGLYLLSVTAQFRIQIGDLLVLIGAFMWATHVLIIAWLSPKMASLKLALLQFTACSLFSLATAALFEPITIEDIRQAAVSILYGGAVSVGIAYTLQVVAQKDAHPAHAAILLSLESVFAAIGGWWLLNETMSNRGLTGCGLMLAGMLVSQLWGLVEKSPFPPSTARHKPPIKPTRAARGSQRRGYGR